MFFFDFLHFSHLAQTLIICSVFSDGQNLRLYRLLPCRRQNIQHSQGLRKPFSSKKGAFICLIKCLGDTSDETIKQLWET